jgi:alanyl-tRNA synthetase
MSFFKLMDLKKIKAEFKRQAQQKPEQHYPVKTLKSLGFNRGQCSNCSGFFWNQDPQRKICGDSSCLGGFSFIGDSPAKKQLDYVGTWKAFAKIHKRLGYTSIPRYPVVARWRDDADFVQAGIYIFQPYVVSGEVKPVANPVVEPQACLRFNDIDNVGITGSHYVGFVMMGEHAFMPPEHYKPEQYINDHLTWLNKGMGLDYGEITVHEDAWGGGGNLGPSMEFFSRGLELSNQVYMQYEILPDGGWKDLDIKVLDMGQGQERVPWFTQGESTSYETTFPTVMKKLRKETGVNINKDFMTRFLPYAGLLNVDEVEDINAVWKKVAGKMDVSVGELRENVQQQAALYSIAEHSRALLWALNDGALPSNVGGGYNLRVIFRRALGLAHTYGWDTYLPDVCEWHATYLRRLFPELQHNLEEVKKILDVEKNKYGNTREKARSVVNRVIKRKITDSVLLKLYDSQGIAPDMVKEEAEKVGVSVEVPENFYASVAELHERKLQVHETSKQKKLDLRDAPETKALFFDDWRVPDKFYATVVAVQGNFVVLDQTWFYATSGGQMHDVGYLNAAAVVDVVKQGPYILHKLDDEAHFNIGDKIECRVDAIRRKQLAQHHTATHIVNAAARKILGQHANQAGAKKTVEKGTIDITHFSALSNAELLAIEREANRIVKDSIVVHKRFIPRDEAEKKFGVGIYQGGVAPGQLLRIVNIEGVDVEACGGTHLNNTSEAEKIHVIGTSKIADDIVRIEFTAGEAARKWQATVHDRGNIIQDIIRKEFKISVTATPHQMQLAAEVFGVSVEQLQETLQKFFELVKTNNKNLLNYDSTYSAKQFTGETLTKFCNELFRFWKEQEKLLGKINSTIAKETSKNLKEGSVAKVDVDAASLRSMAADYNQILIINNKGMFVFKGSNQKFAELVKLGAKGGGSELKQGKVSDVNKVVTSFIF